MRLMRLVGALLLLVCTACSSPASPDLPKRSVPCVAGFTCTTLRVPLGVDNQTLDLTVAAADNVDAPRGVLLMLTGGPGQPGVPLLPRVRDNLHPEVLREYRLVMFDQRGTGSSGINCASLQTAIGGSDFLTAPAGTIEDCAQRIGPGLGHYGTPDTVEDIEQLRRHLGVERLTLNGTSYGSFTAAQYGLRYPERVASLVLDSVVPHKGFDPFGADLMAATGGVLEAACRQDPACTSDPVADLAWLVENGSVDGTELMESLSISSLNTVNPSLKGIPAKLHAARNGDDAALKEFFQTVTSRRIRYDELSAGLHIATLCSDLRIPWTGGRTDALETAVRRLDPKRLYPYDLETARRQLIVDGCLRWPEARMSTYPEADQLLPRTLILHGGNDLFCPVEWAQWQKAHTRSAELVVIPGSGHGVQRDPRGLEAARTFLLG
ncbi:alpha/beta fold hydrolase [Kribbella turkmenica]|uniref:prolyl aminopeptidase n=2 Tax=Kribbella turkmenica TaxID=2530375 RepID=A0A4R4W3G5_9ACTN|nr:alpha/beta fold hydrolase [Kribbella turkmenica]